MEKRILDHLSKNGGATAKAIAATIGCTTTEANRILYRMKRENRAMISDAFRWTLVVKSVSETKKATSNACNCTSPQPPWPT